MYIRTCLFCVSVLNYWPCFADDDDENNNYNNNYYGYKCVIQRYVFIEVVFER
jgi:hypothetical protein